MKKVNEEILCHCGICEQTLWKYDKHGRERKYISGHNNRGKKVFAKGERVCSIDPKHTTTLNELGNEHWYHFNDKYLCYSCAHKIIYQPKYKDKDRKRIRFKNTRPRVKVEYKTGKCDSCSKNVGDTYINKKGEEKMIKSMHTHHKEYHEANVLKDTVQLCPQCHAIESAKTRKLKDMSDRICFRCNRTYDQLVTLIKNFRVWMKIKEKGWLCNGCMSPYKKGQSVKK